MRFTAADVADAVNGRLVGPDTIIEGASTDSRRVAAGQLFVPIEAQRNGHDFIGAALERGAAAYLTQREPLGGTAIVVADTGHALAALGGAARSRYRAAASSRVVGVTGSVGKTSVKDLVGAALRAGFSAVAVSESSFNNEIGLPLTLLNGPDDPEAAVLEMGMRGHGQIAALCAIGQPGIGVITNIGVAHGELVGGPAGIARAKGEMMDALPARGTAILPADSEWFSALADRAPCPVLSFGEDHGDVRVSKLAVDPELRPSFTLESPWGSFEMRLELRGAHMAVNAAAAFAAAAACGVPPATIVEAFAGAGPAAWRMNVHRLAHGVVVINDAYNANPVSMQAALEALAAVPAERHVAIVGVMAELGGEAEEAHREIASLARSLGIELVAVGTDWYGVAPHEDPVAVLGPLPRNVAVLVKASRAAGLEHVADRLLAVLGHTR